MIDAIRDRIVLDWAVPTSHLHDIYENTTAQSGLRRLVVSLISTSGTPDIIEGEDQQLLWPIPIPHVRQHRLSTLEYTLARRKPHICGARDAARYACTP